MTPSDLKYHVENRSTETHFFTRSNMKFSGDTMRNYGVRSAEVITCYDAEGNFVSNEGVTLQVWELYRKRAVKHGLKDSAFFSKETFNRVFPEKVL